MTASPSTPEYEAATSGLTHPVPAISDEQARLGSHRPLALPSWAAGSGWASIALASGTFPEVTA